MLLIILLAVVTTLFAGWRTWRRLRFFLHIFQLEGYKPAEFRTWIRQRLGTIVLRLSHKLGAVELVLVSVGSVVVSPYWIAAFALPAWAVTFASSRIYRSGREKKPLAYTNRMQRLLAAAAVLAASPVLAGLVMWVSGGLAAVAWFLGGFFLADLFAPLWVLLAAALMHPVEHAIREGFKRQARQRLRQRPDLEVISITGSYGKTSTKFILKEVLSQRYNVLATPSSYNTPMGLCLVVNDMLKPEHQVLVLEMGIRHPGDMDELCEIVRPNTGVVTSVGIAHLESMSTIERIAAEKARMIDHLKPNGITVLNADDERVAAMAERAPGRTWRVSVRNRADADKTDADITGTDITYGREGASFLVRDEAGEERRFRTRLLGEHNVTNILLAVAVGRAMGLRLRQMAFAVERLEPIEHRLQLREDGPVTIIDDAFNANPVGARNAVRILGQFEAGRRVIVTPGMIELGERQWEENRTLGEHIAEHVDLAVLVGREQTAPIQEGLRARSFPEDRLMIVDSLWDAQAFLKTYLREGDVVLYENDLPDQFDA